MIHIIITKAGRRALINAEETGVSGITIDKIGVGSGKYTPSETQTALQAEIKRLPIIEGGGTGDNAFHVGYQDDSEDSYTIYEFGIYLSDGTLFAVYSSSESLLQKSTNSTALLTIDVALDDLNAEMITFGDVSYKNGVATTKNAGIIAIATDEEVVEGKERQKAVTPANFNARVATETLAGLVGIATLAEAIEGTDDARAMTPAKVKAQIDSRIATGADIILGTDETKTVTPATLAGRTATTGRTGLIELATEAEALAGSDANLAITPATMRAAIDQKFAAASETDSGTIRLANEAEAKAGTDTGKAITPATLKATLDSRVFKATETEEGIVRLASAEDTIAGTDMGKAVTPYGVNRVLSGHTARLDNALAAQEVFQRQLEQLEARIAELENA